MKSNNNYHEQIKEANHEKLLNIFRQNPKGVFSLTDLQERTSFHVNTIKTHLKVLEEQGLVIEVFSKPRLHLFQYNVDGETNIVEVE